MPLHSPISTDTFATPWLCLASQSPRRAQLLAQLGVPHRVRLPADAQAAEALEAVRAGETPADYVQRVTQAKLAMAIDGVLRATDEIDIGSDEYSVDIVQDAPILCADTTVALGARILGKPADADEAAAMLQALQGRTHQVLTAVAVAWRERRVAALSSSQVCFAPMSAADIAAYVASGEPMGKAGAYGIQGLAAQFVARIEGSYTGIMGLPLFETAQSLKSLSWWKP